MAALLAHPPHIFTPFHSLGSANDPFLDQLSPRLGLTQWQRSHSFKHNGPTRYTEEKIQEANSSLKEALAEIDGILAGCEFLDASDRQKTHQSQRAPWEFSSDSSSSAPYAQSLDSFFEERCTKAAPSENSPPPSSSSSSSSSPSPSSTGNCTSEEDTPHCPPMSAAPPTPTPKNSENTANARKTPFQWSALRVVRDGIDLHYRNFETLCREDSRYKDIFCRLLEDYKTPKRLRKLGILAFRHVLLGAEPDDLTDIFAFAALSYTLAKLLHKRRCITQDKILNGLSAWRDAISDVKDKEAFEFLARRLWPEASNKLNTSCTSSTPLPDTGPGTAAQNHAWFLDQQANGQAPLQTLHRGDIMSSTGQPHGESLSHGAFATAPNTYDRWYAEQLCTMSHSECDFSVVSIEALEAIGPHENLLDNFLEQPSIECGNVGQSIGEPPPSSQRHTTDSNSGSTRTDSTCLRETDMFRVILWCHERLSEVRSLLWKLSGDGTSADNTQPSRGNSALESKRRDFQDQVNEHLFVPLRRRFPDNTQAILLATTKALVIDRVLTSLRAIEEYLMIVSKAFLPGETRQDETETRKFLKAILSQCLSASGKIEHCVYSEHGPDIPASSSPYSSEYVDKKLRDSLKKNSLPHLPKAGGKRQRDSDSGSPEASKTSRVSSCKGRQKQARKTANPGRFACHECGQRYATRHGLSRHRAPGAVFACDEPGCGNEYSRRENLKDHKKRRHTGPQEYSEESEFDA